MKTMLEAAVASWIEDEVEEGYPLEDLLEDLECNGCISGMVSHLIYYNDTTKFYEDHCQEIGQLLAETMDSIGVESPSDLFGDKWDKEDPMANDTMNQNLLAWFAWEETASRLREDR